MLSTIKSAIPKLWAAGRSNGMTTFLVGMNFAAPFLMPAETKEEKYRNIALGTVEAGLSLGYRGFGTQMLMGNVLSLGLANSGEIGRMLPSLLSGGLADRTQLSLPFSHSEVNVQMAGTAFRFAQQRMGNAYSLIGSEAAVMAAKYTR